MTKRDSHFHVWRTYVRCTESCSLYSVIPGCLSVCLFLWVPSLFSTSLPLFQTGVSNVHAVLGRKSQCPLLSPTLISGGGVFMEQQRNCQATTMHRGKLILSPCLFLGSRDGLCASPRASGPQVYGSYFSSLRAKWTY